MDAQQFDALTRALTGGVSRRRVLGALTGTAAGAALTLVGRRPANAAALTSLAAEAVYRDPQGRFTVPIPPNWTVTEQRGYVLLRAPDGDLDVAAAVVTATDAGAGIIAAWRTVDPAFNPATPQPERTEAPGSPGIDQTVVLTYDLGQVSGRVAQGLGQRVGDQVYVLIFRGDLQTAARRQSQINVIVTGFQILGSASADLSKRRPSALSGDRLKTFEAFISTALAAFGVPGAAVAVVQGGKTVYAQGFGVTRPGSRQAITPDTLMMVGSVTKSSTTMLMGTLVDAGRLNWDEPVVKILPTFKVADATMTPKVTVRNLVCACTGVPRRDAELYFQANELTAEDVIASLAGFTFSTPIGEAYQYSNQMVAAGGYVAALADGGHFGQLHEAYLAAMRRHVLGPIGMRRSTFDQTQAGADPDHAQPHGVTLAGRYQPLALTTETWVQPVAPAGGLWSTAHEMVRYVLTELRHGVNPDGARVISARNLEETWKPGVAIDASTSYGLGWMIEQWKGLRIITHGGNTNGFTAEVAFLPDADLGVVVLTNAQEANVVTRGIRQRLLELVYEGQSEIEGQLKTALEGAQTARAKLRAQLGPPIAPARARALLGGYRNPSLGLVTVTYANGALVADAGEFRVALQPLKASPPQGPAFVVADPPFVGRPARFDLTGAAPRLIYGAPPEEYVFDRVTAPATPVASPAA